MAAKSKPLPPLEWNEEPVHLADLKPYERNPRRITAKQFEKLKASIERLGYSARISCTPDNLIVGGHMRLKALQELGFQTVKVLRASRALTNAEYREAILRDNIQNGVFDIDMIGADYDPEELTEMGFPAELMGGSNIPQKDEDGADGDDKEMFCPHCGGHIANLKPARKGKKKPAKTG